ncbi:unnamed protein product [Hymenolepis diminuta]|uniref:Uncharacterized protein n=1 Tax=Hymenolepis diminuta TaxID=6216 RepID=A0A564ZAR1_HYMDI|nr:unnamed protein product [Hymenolepis diminuta]
MVCSPKSSNLTGACEESMILRVHVDYRPTCVLRSVSLDSTFNDSYTAVLLCLLLRHNPGCHCSVLTFSPLPQIPLHTLPSFPSL